MSVARNIMKNPKLVPGGGATEMTVSATLKQKSSSIEGVEKVLDFTAHAISLDDHFSIFNLFDQLNSGPMKLLLWLLRPSRGP